MLAIRGATTIERNDAREIEEASIELMDEIIKNNDINIKDINTILFSCTRDITKAYPGKYVREYFNLSRVAIMHFNEMDVEESLQLCIRVLVYVNNQGIKEGKYIYLRKAVELRKDIITP